MKNSNTPTLCDVIDGLVFQDQEPGLKIDVDYKALEISCIDLITKLDSQLAKARELEQDEFIDSSGEAAQSMIDALSEFTEHYLKGNAATQSREEIDRAAAFVDTYEEFLKARPISKKLIRTFWVVEESDEVMSAHAKLGDALVRACATTLYHAVAMVGLDSDFGREIDQSTLVFVEQLHQSWN